MNNSYDDIDGLFTPDKDPSSTRNTQQGTMLQTEKYNFVGLGLPQSEPIRSKSLPQLPKRQIVPRRRRSVTSGHRQ